MSSRCHSGSRNNTSRRFSALGSLDPTAAVLVLAAVLLLAGCEREARDFRGQRTGDTVPGLVQTGELEAGVDVPDAPTPAAYQDNRWAVSEGKRLFTWYNCAGCHSPGGGGAMGPPLIDAEWIYGSRPAQVFSTIMEGRPNGMPSFHGRVTAADTWKLVAWVRTLGRLTPPDVWPARGDELAEVQRDGPRSPDDLPRTRRPAPRQ